MEDAPAFTLDQHNQVVSMHKSLFTALLTGRCIGNSNEFLETGIDMFSDLADQYGSLDAVAGALERLTVKKLAKRRDYLRFADSPGRWIMLAYRLRSKKLYEEAFVHLVGKLVVRFGDAVGGGNIAREFDGLPEVMRNQVMKEVRRVWENKFELHRMAAAMAPPQAWLEIGMWEDGYYQSKFAHELSWYDEVEGYVASAEWTELKDELMGNMLKIGYGTTSHPRIYHLACAEFDGEFPWELEHVFA